MPGGQFLKALQVIGQVPEQAIILANGPVAGNSHNYGDVMQNLVFHIIQKLHLLYADADRNFPE